MKSLCLFASYLPSNTLPYYVKVYLEELKKHFSEVQLLGHVKLESKDEEYLKQSGVDYIRELNEGYDFGLWYKALKAIDTATYDRIALVNDSCILFKPLKSFMNALEQSRADVYGMTCSEAISLHVQSYFLILNKKAIAPALAYFDQTGIGHNLQEVIRMYEVGLSRHLIERGLRLEAFVDNKDYKGEFSPYYHLLDHHLKQGIPLIKKKIIFSSYRKDELFTLARMNFKIRPEKYIDSILNDRESILKREELMKDISGSLSALQRLRYATLRLGIHSLKSFKNLFSSSR
jgi:lipopolysaccharide biosynthesis protein